MARSGATILFEGRRPRALPRGPEIEETSAGATARLEGELDLEVEPTSEPVDLGSLRVRLCHVRGEAAGRKVDCLGTLADTSVPPRWEELDAVRTVSALVDDEHALLMLARAPAPSARARAGARDGRAARPGQLHEGRGRPPVHGLDGDGRQRSAGLELWLPGEEYPRRGSGMVVAGSSLALEGLEVHAAVFRWRLDGREGIGAYELMARTEPPAAA